MPLTQPNRILDTLLPAAHWHRATRAQTPVGVSRTPPVLHPAQTLAAQVVEEAGFAVLVVGFVGGHAVEGGREGVGGGFVGAGGGGGEGALLDCWGCGCEGRGEG